MFTPRPAHRRSLALLVVAALAACADPSPPPTAPHARPQLATAVPPTYTPYTISFQQLNISFDDDPMEPYTEWGIATVQFDGSSTELYANLVVNGTWQVQNIPLSSPEGPGVPVTRSFEFDLGTAPGTPVDALQYDFVLVDRPIERMPLGATPATVGHTDMVLAGGVQGGSIGGKAKPKPPVKGDTPVDQASHANFPNQDAGKNECGPTAASNSLQWLKAKNKLAVDDALISIDAMKKAQGFNVATGVPGNWYLLKDKYLREKKVPIKTRAEGGLGGALAAMKKGCDVEIGISGNPIGHLVALTEIKKLKNGSFVLQITHDSDQSKVGGTVTETVTWDPGTGTLNGTPWINGRTVTQVVSECVTTT
ncbi:hypothetical protein J421_6113 (plasmid) [Gemmatirosa kalamazoonensis]|uniref:Peptidase C39-like domain-containing protein n=1 Tax=Gemmatirosa kalamazoonensis TaxID=861299 RepID=W0RVN9_9BACT|nr:hypothetical protein [Gemmatirosa kalamazoonensis]AHG93648.1 hypothetical protein J421_6113 [Gemmatirosa kalamazoonensis]